MAAPSLAPSPSIGNIGSTASPKALPYRIGHGFDLHRLEEGPYKLILGGLEIPHDRGCVAHSDGAQAFCCMMQCLWVMYFHALMQPFANAQVMHFYIRSQVNNRVLINASCASAERGPAH